MKPYCALTLLRFRLIQQLMECRTAIVRDVRGGRALQPDDRGSRGGGFLRRRALRGTLGGSGVATDDGEVSVGLLRV